MYWRRLLVRRLQLRSRRCRRSRSIARPFAVDSGFAAIRADAQPHPVRGEYAYGLIQYSYTY